MRFYDREGQDVDADELFHAVLVALDRVEKLPTGAIRVPRCLIDVECRRAVFLLEHRHMEYTRVMIYENDVVRTAQDVGPGPRPRLRYFMAYARRLLRGAPFPEMGTSLQDI